MLRTRGTMPDVCYRAINSAVVEKKSAKFFRDLKQNITLTLKRKNFFDYIVISFLDSILNKPAQQAYRKECF